MHSKYILLLFILGLVGFQSSLTAQVTDAHIWVNEFHYDEETSYGEPDQTEFIELVVANQILDNPTEVAKLKLVLYTAGAVNVADDFARGLPYHEASILYSEAVSVHPIANNNADGSGDNFQRCDPGGSNYSFLSKDLVSLQDVTAGFAIIYDDEVVAQFISYEGTFKACDCPEAGAAAGMTSELIDAPDETASTADDHSIQLTGTGDKYDDFSWSGGLLLTENKCAINSGQTINDLACIAPLVDDPGTLTASCVTTYTLPPITGSFLSGNEAYYDNLQASGIANEITEVTGTGIVYIYDSNAAGCDHEVAVTVNFDAAVDVSPVTEGTTACDALVLPNVTVTDGAEDVAYFTMTGGMGTRFEIGQEIMSSMDLYAYAISGTCSDEEFVSFTVNTTPTVEDIPNGTHCDGFTLPVINADGDYFTESGGMGTALTAGQDITASGTYYIYADNNGCTAEQSFIINITPTPVITEIGDQTDCEAYDLPVIEGSNLSGTLVTGYYPMSGGVGEKIPAGTTITETTTLYRYDVVGECFDEEEITITILGLPTIAEIASQEICTGESHTFMAVPSGGTSYTYQWQKDGMDINMATTDSYEASEAGDYTVIVTDQNSCAQTSNVATLTVNALPTVEDLDNQTICADANHTFTAVPSGGNSYTYQWQKDGADIDMATASTYEASEAGDYRVIVANENNCSVTSNAATLTVNALPTVEDLTNQTICADANHTFTAVPSGGNSYTYQWQKDGADIDMATASTYQASEAGDYRVIVANENNCSATSNAATLTVNALPTVEDLTNQTICADANHTFTAVPSGGNSYTYQWQKDGADIDMATASTYQASEAGDYRVIVANENNCSATSNAATLTVNTLPTVEDLTNQTICADANHTFTAVPSGGNSYTYQWQKDGADIDMATASTYQASEAGDYRVIVANENNCSVTSNAATLTVNALPTVEDLNNQVICADASHTFTAVPSGGNSYTYQWQKDGVDIDMATASTYEASDAGDYRVIVANENNCSVTSNSATLTAHASSTVEDLTNQTICADANHTFTAVSSGGASYSYQWQKDGVDIDMATASTYEASEAGDYQVIVTNENNCSVTSNAATLAVNALPTVEDLNNQIVCANETFTFTAVPSGGNSYTYQWQKDGANIDMATASTYQANEAGDYRVTVFNENNCSVTSNAANLFINPLISLSESITDQSQCGNTNNGSITVTPNGGTSANGEYDYEWDTGFSSTGTIGTLSALAADDYTVTVRDDNDCEQVETYTVDCAPPPLSVDLLRFTVKLSEKNDAVLQWMVANENNFSHYEILRSDDNKSWTNLGKVSGGTSLYEFVDKKLLSLFKGGATLYYQLKMVNEDASFDLSDIRTLVLPEKATTMEVYPNPSKGQLTVLFSTEQNETAQLQILTVTGQLVQQFTLENPSALDRQELNLSTLPSGVYFLQLQLKEGSQQVKVVLE